MGVKVLLPRLLHTFPPLSPLAMMSGRFALVRALNKVRAVGIVDLIGTSRKSRAGINRSGGGD